MTDEDKMWDEPKVVNSIDLAFPAHVTGIYLPHRDEVSKEAISKYSEIVNRWFSLGLPDGVSFMMRNKPDGEIIDGNLMLRQIQTCMGSFQPKHEDKIDGICHLLHKWCSGIKFPDRHELNQ